MPDWKAEVERRISRLNLEKTREASIGEELAQHLEDRYQDLLASGSTEREALRQTLDEIKDSHSLLDELNAVERLVSPEPAPRNKGAFSICVHDCWQDFRYGLRMLYKSRSFTATAILSLAIGIGANTAIFSVVDSLLLRPWPVKDANQLTVLAFRQGDGPLLTPFSIADFRDIRSESTQVFSDMLGYQIGIDGLSTDGRTERVVSHYVTENYFPMLGIKAQLGRLILPSEGKIPGADPVMVLSYSYWKDRFGGDPGIIGRNVQVNGHPVDVVGIAPEGFYGLDRFSNGQVFMPLGMLTLEAFPRDFMVNRILQNLSVMGRIRPTVNLQAATAALDVVARRLSAAYPDTDKNLKLSVYWEKYARPDPVSAGILIKASALFLILVALVLLLACTNVANLMVVRSTMREREIAIRMALGASRTRIVRQLLTESMLLALLGGVTGLILGVWTSRAVTSISLHTNLPVRTDFVFSWRLFVYLFGAVLTSGLLIGLLPAFRASGWRTSTALHVSGRGVAPGKHRVRTAFVVLELTGAVMLLVMAALFLKSLRRVEHTDLGFDPSNVVNLTMDPAEIGYTESQGLAFYRELRDRIKTLPGVEAATLNASVPLGYYSNNDYLNISDYQNPPRRGLPLVYYSVTSPEYLNTMRIPLVRGRGFTDADIKGSPYVAIVNEAFVRHFWPGQNPIGKHFSKVSGITNPTYEVVGVAKDSRFLVLTGPIGPYFYLPLAQNYSLASEETLEVRSRLPHDAVIRAVEQAVHDLRPELPVWGVRTMNEALDNLQGFFLFRFGAALAAVLAGLGLILAVVGVYGVISYSLSQRRQEIGIRLALGAQQRDILRLILGQGMVIIGVGTGLGALAAFSVARLTTGLLAGVSPDDPTTYLAVSGVLALITLSACYFPARQAAIVDPTVVLHQE